MDLHIIEAISSILAISGAILNSMRNKLCYTCYLPANVLWIFYGFSTQQYFFMSQFMFFSVLSIAGFTNWHRLESKEP